MISIESVSNFRDVSIGSKMKKNLLFRCAKLSTLNEQDIRVLENLNPHAIIDFRDPKEVKMAPDNLSPKLLEKYINLPISASTLSRMVSEKQLNGDDVKSFEKEIMPNTKAIYIETPSNPLLKLVDIKEIANLAKSNGLISFIDNTFATPLLQKPHKLGIDIILHSATKYFGGHSDICAGAVASSSEHREIIWNLSKNIGGSLSV